MKPAPIAWEIKKGKKEKRTRKPHHMWTKDEIKTMYRLWEESSVEDIAKELNLERNQVVGMAINMRKAGFNMPKKHHTGRMQHLLSEVLLESKSWKKRN